MGCTAKRCSTVTHNLNRWIGERPPGAETDGSVNAQRREYANARLPTVPLAFAWRINAYAQRR